MSPRVLRQGGVRIDGEGGGGRAEEKQDGETSIQAKAKWDCFILFFYKLTTDATFPKLLVKQLESLRGHINIEGKEGKDTKKINAIPILN